MSELCSLSADFFIVLRTLPTTWSTEIGLPMDSQVVRRHVRAFCCPASLGCGHPSHAFEANRATRSMLPCWVESGGNHDSRVIVCSSIIGGPARSRLLIHTFVLPVCLTTICIVRISSSNIALFLSNCAHSLLISWSLFLQHWMTSSNHRIASFLTLIGEVASARSVSSYSSLCPPLFAAGPIIPSNPCHVYVLMGLSSCANVAPASPIVSITWAQTFGMHCFSYCRDRLKVLVLNRVGVLHNMYLHPL